MANLKIGKKLDFFHEKYQMTVGEACMQDIFEHFNI